MAKISSYPQADVPLSGSDMLIGTDTVNDNETKNFTLSELAQFIDGDIGGNYVPYTGATGDVNLGSNSLTTSNLYINGFIFVNNSSGLAGQILTNTGSGVSWANVGVPTLQQVLTSGRDLTNDRNFQGQGSGTSNTGNQVIGFGVNSAFLNTGNNVIGIGVSSVGSNTRDFVIGIGVNASSLNTGTQVIGIGTQASQANVGDFTIGIGNAASNNNEGNHVIGIGYRASLGNEGDDVISLGKSSGENNIYNNVNLFGASAVATNNNQTVLAGEEYQVRLDYNGLTIDRQYNMPNADGTLVLSVNGTAPDAAGNVNVPLGWSTIGNAGTNPSTNFIGTTDAQDLVLKSNNVEGLRILPTGWAVNNNTIAAVGPTSLNSSSIQVYSNGATRGVNISHNSTLGGYVSIQNGTGFNSAIIKSSLSTGTRIIDLPNANGTLVLSVNGTAPDAAGNVVVTASGGVQTAKISLTSANILSLTNSSNPFLLIPAPGASKFLNVLSITTIFNFVTTEYSGNNSLNYSIGQPDLGGLFLVQATSVLNFPFNIVNIKPINVGTTNTTAIGGIQNQGLYVYCTPTGPTLGDSTVNIYVSYIETNI